MAQRYLSLENYRNIGIGKSQKLLLNTSIEKNGLGDLIILVGPNNSGKSNCLDGLLSLGEQNSLASTDAPDFFTEIKSPRLGLIIEDDEFHVGVRKWVEGDVIKEKKFIKLKGEPEKSSVTKPVFLSPKSVDFLKKLLSVVPYKRLEKPTLTNREKDFAIASLQFVASSPRTSATYSNSLHEAHPEAYSYLKAYNNYKKWVDGYDSMFVALFDYLKKRYNENFHQSLASPFSRYSSEEVKDIIAKLTGVEIEKAVELSSSAISLLETFQTAGKSDANGLFTETNPKNIKAFVDEVKEIYDFALKIKKDNPKITFDYSGPQIKVMLAELALREVTSEAPEIMQWEKDNKISLTPKIVKFKETEINQKALTVKPSDIGSSPFFKILFKSIQFDVEELKRLYDGIKAGTVVAKMLRLKEIDLNQKIAKISDQFNRLFFLKDLPYVFTILLETERIDFAISVGNLPLHLDKQSTGFRWFFNFYFSVIAQNDVKRGDIVIMDEPATNLHVSGIQELRSFMKDFARASEITFVISTHSPFFIDIDHLDEVRVVHRKKEEAVITNMFHVIEEDDTDALRPIKDALTVGRHILVHPSEKTIFVEGITDYCYLTMFKNAFPNAKSIHFMPVQGLKKNDLIGKIMVIDPQPTILVDSDHYGRGLVEQCKSHPKGKHVEVIQLHDVDEKFTDIESLFEPSDKPAAKSFESAVKMKRGFDVEKLHTNTVENFKRLFKNIMA